MNRQGAKYAKVKFSPGGSDAGEKPTLAIDDGLKMFFISREAEASLSAAVNPAADNSPLAPFAP